MDANTPLISVIVPAYNSEKYIAETIKSLLRQEYEKLEVIVVNDGSTDATLDVLGQFGDRIRIISQENKGISIARNTGIRAAKGSIIGFLDHDDIWPDDHISLLLPHLLKDDKYDFVSGKFRYVKDYGMKSEQMSEAKVLWLVGVCLYKKSVFDKVGLFDESIHGGEDVDFYARLCESECNEGKINETTLFWRQHDSNTSNTENYFEKSAFNVVRNRLARAKLKPIK